MGHRVGGFTNELWNAPWIHMNFVIGINEDDVDVRIQVRRLADIFISITSSIGKIEKRKLEISAMTEGQGE